MNGFDEIARIGSGKYLGAISRSRGRVFCNLKKISMLPKSVSKPVLQNIPLNMKTGS